MFLFYCLYYINSHITYLNIGFTSRNSLSDFWQRCNWSRMVTREFLIPARVVRDVTLLSLWTSDMMALHTHTDTGERLYTRLSHLSQHPLPPRSPEILVHPLKAGLFPRQRPTPKYGLEVDPLPLDGVEVLEVLVEVGQPGFPQRHFVLEARVIGRVFERLQQAAVVAHLVDHVLPVLDDAQRAALTVRVVGQGETRAGAPQLQLPQSLADGDLGLSATVQILKPLLRVFMTQIMFKTPVEFNSVASFPC